MDQFKGWREISFFSATSFITLSSFSICTVHWLSVGYYETRCAHTQSYCINILLKNTFFWMAMPLRPYPLPPLEINGSRNFFNKSKKCPKKCNFFLMASVLPPPLLMALPLRIFLRLPLSSRKKIWLLTFTLYSMLFY